MFIANRIFANITSFPCLFTSVAQLWAKKTAANNTNKSRAITFLLTFVCCKNLCYWSIKSLFLARFSAWSSFTFNNNKEKRKYLDAVWSRSPQCNDNTTNDSNYHKCRLCTCSDLHEHVYARWCNSGRSSEYTRCQMIFIWHMILNKWVQINNLSMDTQVPNPSHKVVLFPSHTKVKACRIDSE